MNRSRYLRRGRWPMRCLAVAVVLLCLGLPLEAQTEEDFKRLEGEVEKLRAVIEQLQAAQRKMEKAEAEAEAAESPAEPIQVAELARRLDVLAAELENIQLGNAAVEEPATLEDARYGLGIAASKVYRVDQGLSIGGYGEALYENFDSTREDGADSGRTDQFDFLRAILYFGYKFNDKWVLNTEIEIEHADEIFLEFATIDYLWKPSLNLRAGLVLVPMGLLNELHEPTLFLSAERPRVESTIIPSTWRENGIGIFGDNGKFAYRSYIVNGLDGGEFSSSGLRGGRQKGSRAKAESLAWVGRFDYVGTPGLLVGASLYVGDSGQGIEDALGSEIGAQTTIFDAHFDWKLRGWSLRALYARAELDDVTRLNQALGLSGSASIGEELDGFYVEAGYDLFSRRDDRGALVPFLRYETLDTQAEVPAGFSRNPSRDSEILTFGFAYQPIDQLIFKVDYQDVSNEGDTGVDQWNFAIGYLF